MAKKFVREVVIGPVATRGASLSTIQAGDTAAVTASATDAATKYVPYQHTTSGYYNTYWNYSASGTTPALAGNNLRLHRVYQAEPATGLAFEVTTNGATTLAIGVYSDVAYAPGTLLYSSTGNSVSTSGIKTLTLAIPVGWYWIGALNETATTMTPRSIPGSTPYYNGADALTAGGVPGCAWSWTGVASTLPTGSLGAPVSKIINAMALYYRVA